MRVLAWTANLLLLVPFFVLIYQKLQAPWPMVAVVLIAIALYLIGLSRLPWEGSLGRVQLLSPLIGLVAALVTFYLSTGLGLGPFVASGLVGLLASRVLAPEDAIVAYAAAFVGMSSLETVGSIWLVGAAGVVLGTVFTMTKGCLPGVGGRLGTLAAASLLLVKIFA